VRPVVPANRRSWERFPLPSQRRLPRKAESDAMNQLAVVTDPASETDAPAGGRGALPPHLRATIAAALAARRPAIRAGWWASQFDPARIQRYAIVGTRQSRETLEQFFLT